MFLSLTNPDPRNSVKKSDQRSRSYLDLTVQIQSGFHTSRFRHSWRSVFLSLQSPDPRNSVKQSYQWSRSHLDLTVAITSQFRISRYRVIFFDIFNTRSSKPRKGLGSMVQILSWFNGCDWITNSHITILAFLLRCFLVSLCHDSRNSDMELAQRSRSDLDSTAVIKSRFWISRNRDSCGWYYLTSPTLDPRNSDIECPPSFGILYTHFSLYFKERAGSPWSNDGRFLRLDLTSEICHPL